MSAHHGGWNRFPIWMALAMGTVFAVNARFITLAVTTFPGAATTDDFDASNTYDQVLLGVERQHSLGWRLNWIDQAAPVALAVTSRQGAPVSSARVDGVARRPVGDEADLPVWFLEGPPGRYILQTRLRPGQWDLVLRVSLAGQELRQTKRILMP